MSKIYGLILFLSNILWAQHDTIQTSLFENSHSIVASRENSGYAELSYRYWWVDWGVQGSTLPYYRSHDKNNSVDYSIDLSLILMRKLWEGKITDGLFKTPHNMVYTFVDYHISKYQTQKSNWSVPHTNTGEKTRIGTGIAYEYHTNSYLRVGLGATLGFEQSYRFHLGEVRDDSKSIKLGIFYAFQYVWR